MFDVPHAPIFYITKPAYIQNEKGHLPLFVMGPINEIKQLSTKISDWNYISREQNPADLCTRTQILN